MKNILIFLFILFCIAVGLWYFDNAEAQKIDILGEIYYTDTDPNSEFYNQEVAVYAVQGITTDKDIISSNVERLSDTKYVIYSGLPQFIDQGDYWSEINYVKMLKTDYDYLYKNVEIISFIQSAMAQTYYPTFDGRFYYIDVSHATAHDATDAENLTSATSPLQLLYGFTGGSYFVERLPFIFDSSAIDNNYSATSASFSFTCDSTDTTINYADSLVFVDFNPADSGSITTADFDMFGSVGNEILTSEIICDGTHYNTITVHIDLLSNISVTGVSAFGIRTDDDIDNTTPTQTNSVNFQMSSHGGTSADPKLIVEFEISATPTSTISYASSSFSDVDIASELIKTSLNFFIVGMIFAIWYFRRNNKRVF